MRRNGPICLVVVCAAFIGACSANPEQVKHAALESGDRFFEQKRYQEAVVEYRRALQADGMFGEARRQLARTYAQMNERERAGQEYIRAADLLPNDDAVQIMAGQYLIAAGRFEDARARAETVLRRDPRNYEAQMLLGQSAASMKNLDGAISEIQEAIQIAPADMRGHTTLGLLQLAKGNTDVARQAFERAVELQPGSIEARLSLVGYYWTRNDAPAVERELKAVLEREPRNPTANRTLATFYVLTNRVAEAEPYFLRLTEEAKDGRPFLALADYYQLANRPDDATRVLERLTQDPQMEVVARTKLAMMAYERKRHSEAHRQVDDVLRQYPTNPPALLLKARFAMAEGRLDESLKLLKDTIAAEPAAAAAHYYAGLVYAQTNRLDEAVASLSESLRLNPQLAPAQLQLARVNLARGNAAESAQLSRQVLSREPGDATSRLVLVDSLLAQGDVAGAERELLPLEKALPNAASVHVRRARLAAGRGDMDQARRSFARAQQLDARSFDALSGLVATDIAANRMSDAIARIDRGLAASPKDLRLLLMAGNVYLTAGQFAKAEEVSMRAVNLDASTLAAYDLLGRIYLAQGKVDEARARFEHLEKQDRTSTAPSTIVAMLLQAQNRTDEARKRFEAVVERNPKAVAAANNLAWIYAETGGDLDRALQLATTARQAAPNEPKIVDTIGWIYFKKNLPLLAVPEFEKAIALDPSNAAFHHHLGLALIAGGQSAKGTAALQRALTLQPNYPAANEVRQLIAKHR
jgi:tetratricopeptide (TPR) repeat protein